MMTELQAIVIVFITVLLVYYIDKSNHAFVVKILEWVPAILFAYIIPAILVQCMGLDLDKTILSDWSKNLLIPLAILMVMTTLTIQQLRLVGWKPIIVFLSGSFWIATFPIIYYVLFIKGTNSSMLDMWRGIPPIVGSWIGGSTSQVALKEIAQTPENLFLTVLIFDNVLVNIWTILMFQMIKLTSTLNGFFKINTAMPDLDFRGVTQLRAKNPYLGLAILFLIALLSSFLPISFIYKIILLSLLGMILSSTLKIWDQKLVLKYSRHIIILIMAILGLKLNFDNFSIDIVFLLFLIIWLLGHLIFMIIIAKLFNVNIVWVPIASMANVGGIATAPAVTASYNQTLMPHAVILAILSMVTGTGWGIITIWLFETFVI